MNESEVSRAWGEPTTKEISTWTWDMKPGACLKFDGDTCVQHEQRYAVLSFTANGNVYLEGEDCRALNVNDQWVIVRKAQIFHH